MAARLARAKATVQANGDKLQGVSVLVRANVATVRLGTDVILERAEVARVEPNGRRSWLLRFEGSEDTWTVTDEKRRCCGQR